MQFLPLTVGSPNLEFPPTVSLTVPFTLPEPASSARAVLRGFDLQYADPDHHLRKIHVNLATFHGAGDRSGTVEVEFALRDDSAHSHISGQIFLLIVAV